MLRPSPRATPLASTEAPSGIAAIPLTIEDFRGCGYENAFQAPGSEGPHYASGYKDLPEALRTEAQKAGKTGQQQGALEVLAECCAMALQPDDEAQPLRIPLLWEGKGSSVPESLSSLELRCLAELAPAVEDPFLKARLAVIAWVRQKEEKGNSGAGRFAELAIEAYQQLPLESEPWVHGLGNCWCHAMTLAKGCSADSQQYEAILEKLVARGLQAPPGDAILALIALGLVPHLGNLSAGQQSRIGEELIMRGYRVGSGGLAQRYYEAAVAWHMEMGDLKRAETVLVLLVEAIMQSSAPADEGQYYGDSKHIGEVMAVWSRSLAGKEPSLRMAMLIDRVQRHRENLAQTVLARQGKLIASGELEGEGEAQRVAWRNAFKRQRGVGALAAYLSEVDSLSTEGIKARAIERKHEPISLLIKELVGDGARGGGEGKEDAHPVLFWYEGLLQRLAKVELFILPGLKILKSDCGIGEDAIAGLAETSQFIPPDSERLWRAGLLAGYRGHFAVAHHFLVVRFEDAIRYHMVKQGATVLRRAARKKTRDAPSVNYLLEKSGQEIFCEGPLSQIKWLLLKPEGDGAGFGENTRNIFSHGLFGDEILDSPMLAFFWWFTLYLVFLGASDPKKLFKRA